MERDLIVAKLQRPELESNTSAEKEAGGDCKDGSNAPRRRTVGVPTSLERLQLDRQTLADLGLSSETVATLYRTIYVFTVGFHEHASHVLHLSSIVGHNNSAKRWRRLMSSRVHIVEKFAPMMNVVAYHLRKRNLRTRR